MKYSEIIETIEYKSITRIIELSELDTYRSIRDFLVKNILTDKQVSFISDSLVKYDIDISECDFTKFKRTTDDKIKVKEPLKNILKHTEEKESVPKGREEKRKKLFNLEML